MKRSEKILNGMKEISAFLGRSIPTVLKLHRDYDMPIKKVEGIWVAHRDNLEDWWKNHCNP
ncbi:MAG: hypothetical protein RBR03_09020 [Desulfuromonas thiophila]|jgi:hypothetical protein|nr:hypothetical protein [Desulfuromonas thiophila]MDY0398786.1 hypothetical protein [Desulfuromonas thiophila]